MKLRNFLHLSHEHHFAAVTETSTGCMPSITRILVFTADQENHTSGSIHLSKDGRICTICCKSHKCHRANYQWSNVVRSVLCQNSLWIVIKDYWLWLLF